MLQHLGYRKAAVALEDGVRAVTPTLTAVRGPEMGMSTEDIGDAVAERISEVAPLIP